MRPMSKPPWVVTPAWLRRALRARQRAIRPNWPSQSSTAWQVCSCPAARALPSARARLRVPRSGSAEGSWSGLMHHSARPPNSPNAGELTTGRNICSAITLAFSAYPWALAGGVTFNSTTSPPWLTTNAGRGGIPAAAKVSIGNEGTARPAPSASTTARPSLAAARHATRKPSAPLSGGTT
ncbi:hypothetical protein D3C81_1226310 [compost metagenome]